MKIFLFLIITIFILIGILRDPQEVQKKTLTIENNIEQQPINIVAGEFQDSYSGVLINDLNYTSQVISDDGKTWFFENHQNMIHWIKDKPLEQDTKIWVYTLDTKQYINGKTAYYAINEKTPMHSKIASYKNYKEGLISFESMVLHTLNNIHILKTENNLSKRIQ